MPEERFCEINLNLDHHGSGVDVFKDISYQELSRAEPFVQFW